MLARSGDWLVIKGTLVGSPDEVGLVLEVRGADGTPPYLVKWLRNDHEGLVFPGPDAIVLTPEQKAVADEQQRRRIDEMQRAIHNHSLRSSPVG